MKVIRHILCDMLILFLMLGLPFLRTDYCKALMNPDADAVSSASVIVDKPSGTYLVCINLEKHTDDEALEIWRDFFTGKEIDLIFEDIVCSVAKSDSNAGTLAENYQSRLPEHQCEIRKEDVTLMLSKAEHLKFDILVMSQEIADFYHADTLRSMPEIEIIQVQGAES
ncbi:MAG: hypothetical protein IJ644_04510 [Oscillospiraceae bacterium]|nr:hypothetical protein [Oscillospiraceae bacterium]